VGLWDALPGGVSPPRRRISTLGDENSWLNITSSCSLLHICICMCVYVLYIHMYICIYMYIDLFNYTKPFFMNFLWPSEYFSNSIASENHSHI
jgi:hypothetical protein